MKDIEMYYDIKKTIITREVPKFLIERILKGLLRSKDDKYTKVVESNLSTEVTSTVGGAKVLYRDGNSHGVMSKIL
jgi:hypothetical protein